MKILVAGGRILDRGLVSFAQSKNIELHHYPYDSTREIPRADCAVIMADGCSHELMWKVKKQFRGKPFLVSKFGFSHYKTTIEEWMNQETQVHKLAKIKMLKPIDFLSCYIWLNHRYSKSFTGPQLSRECESMKPMPLSGMPHFMRELESRGWLVEANREPKIIYWAVNHNSRSFLKRMQELGVEDSFNLLSNSAPEPKPKIESTQQSSPGFLKVPSQNLTFLQRLSEDVPPLKVEAVAPPKVAEAPAEKPFELDLLLHGMDEIRSELKSLKNAVENPAAPPDVVVEWPDLGKLVTESVAKGMLNAKEYGIWVEKLGPRVNRLSAPQLEALCSFIDAMFPSAK